MKLANTFTASPFTWKGSQLSIRPRTLLINCPYISSTTPSVLNVGSPTFSRNSVSWYEDSSGVLQAKSTNTEVIEYSSGTRLGLRIEPQRQNKVTAYNVIGADKYGTELAAGNLTKGKVYEITARDDQDFTADGAADNNVGTQFVATDTTVTLDAGDKVKEIGGTQLNADGTDEGTFETGLGTGAKAYHDGAVFQNPIPGVLLSGDTAAVLSVVSDTAAIATAGLQNICTSGKVYKLDNSGGAADAFATFSGVTGNTNKHQVWLFIRSSGSITARLGLSFGEREDISVTNTYQQKIASRTPGGADRTLVVEANAGQTLWFTVPQLEEGSAVTSPIITQGAAVTRAADDLRFNLIGNFSQTEGMVCATIVPGFDKGDVANKNIISTKSSGVSLLHTSGTGFLQMYDGTTFATDDVVYSSGDTLKICVGWSSLGEQITVNGSSSTLQPYDGAFTTDANNQIFIGSDTTERFWIKKFQVYRFDGGQAKRELITA